MMKSYSAIKINKLQLIAKNVESYKHNAKKEAKY